MSGNRDIVTGARQYEFSPSDSSAENCSGT